jgi:sulfate adenylyltransferase
MTNPTTTNAWPSWDLTAKQVCDLELLMNDAFAPLHGYLSQAEVQSVQSRSRLVDGTLWPLPVTLDVSIAFAETLATGMRVALRDAEGVMLAALHVREVHYIADAATLAGDVEPVQLPAHYDFVDWRLTPAQVRAAIHKNGWQRVLAVQPQAPLTAAECAWAKVMAQSLSAGVLLQPIAPALAPDDAAHYARIRAHLATLPHFEGNAILSILPLVEPARATHPSLFHALIAKNFGATDIALPHGMLSEVDVVKAHAEEMGIGVHFMPAFVNDEALPEVAAELQRLHPPRDAQGFTVFFTGLSGAGKSTIANALVARLHEMGGRRVTLLDGDRVRKHLSSELGFSKAHRDLNIRRIGYVASEITKHGGIAVCAPIAPYEITRRQVREMIEPLGGFVLVHVATPIEACERRDRKGLYAKARAGVIKEFTGVSDPYEPPANAEVVIDTLGETPAQSAERIITHLREQGYL